MGMGIGVYKGNDFDLGGTVSMEKNGEQIYLRHHYRARNWTFDKNHFFGLFSKFLFKTDLLVKTV